MSCSTEGVECEYTEDNLIDSILQVASVAECRQLCQDEDTCEYITYFDSSAVPVSRQCRLFTTCPRVTSCTSCVTQRLDCFHTCGGSFYGHMDENILDAVSNVASELDCKTLCAENGECSWYTYFFRNDTVNHEHCYLQTEFLPPSHPCDTCSSGPVNCSDTGCSLSR